MPEKELFDIIETDAELDAIYEKLVGYSCDCVDEDTLDWEFRIICLSLLPFLVLSMIAFLTLKVEFLLVIVVLLGITFNCKWLHFF